jgi:rsbT co-antagonist protein RsbR
MTHQSSSSPSLPPHQLEHFSRVLEFAGLILTESDAQGNITYINQATRRYFGYAPEECIGKSVLTFTHPDDRDTLQQTMIELVNRQQRSAEIENRVIHRDGTVCVFLWSIVIHYDDDGNLTGFTSIGQDISALHQLRDKLYEKREILYNVIDNLPLGIFWKDKESRFLGCNRRVLQDAGLSTFAEIIGKTDFELPWRNKAAAYQAHDQVVLTSGPRLNIEETLVRGDGSSIWLRTGKVPLIRNQQVAGVIGFYEDITEQPQKEQERRTLLLLVENAPDGIALLDPQLTITYANPAWLTMLGKHELVGQSWVDLVHPDDRPQIATIVQQAMIGSSPRTRLRYIHSDGSVITAYISLPVLRNRQGTITGYGLINHDITEELKSAERLRASEQRQRALLQAIPDLIFVMTLDGIFLDYHTNEIAPAIPPEYFLNRHFAEVLPPELADLTARNLEELKRTGSIQRYEYQMQIDGQIRDYEGRMTLSGNDVLVAIRDITEQRQVERERQTIAMQEQIIAAQQAILQELSTPLLPIADGIVAMPLIGAIDSNRAQLVMESLLSGVAEYRASIAIIDITGVRVVDTQVAGALLRTAQAAGMLGAQVVITGIRPEIAQTMVYIGADLGNMVTKATLQEGIAFALNHRRVKQSTRSGNIRIMK